MARDWQSSFDAWGKPPSDAEESERRRTEMELRLVLTGYPPLKDKSLRIYAKGSYRRGTNVRRGSDVDIAVELQGSVSTGKSFKVAKLFDAKGLSDGQLGLIDSDLTYTVVDLKRDIFDALSKSYPGRVEWSNKCIKVGEKATTLPADVVPCRTYRRYDSESVYHEGIEITPDTGPTIINWPDQDDANGTSKNTRTSQRFKRAVRGIKSLENEMADRGFIQPVPSFMMECAVYNVPDRLFDSPSNFSNCVNALQEMQRAIDSDEYQQWEEVNELKYLFRPTQSWTIDDMARLVDRSFAYLAGA